MIDQRLLWVERYLEESSEQELSEYLGLSKRQLTRLLKQWQAEGYIEYTAGNGRGRKMDIQFKVDVEKELFLQAINDKEEMTVQEIQEYLKLPWHPSSRAAIVNLLTENIALYDKAPSNEVIMDYIYSIPERIHPLYTNDVAGAQVLHQTLSNLYCVDEKGILRRELARYDEWVGKAFHIYLHKDIHFSDGTLLRSKHIKHCLEQLMGEGIYQNVFIETGIKKISIVDDFHLVIECQIVNQNMKFLLSEPFSGIYKEMDGKIQGTGPYYIKAHTNEQITLESNPYYKRQPVIGTIHLLQNREKAIAYHSKKYGQTKSNTCYVSNEFLLFNPKTSLSKQEREYLKQLLIYIVYEKTKDSYTLYDRKHSEDQKPVPPAHSPIHLTIMADEYTNEIIEYIKAQGEPYHVEVEIMKVNHRAYLANDLKDYPVDMIWMSETYYQHQPYQTYNLLSHCKVRDWYEECGEAQTFLNTIQHDQPAAVILGKQFVKMLLDEAYLIELFIKRRRFILPSKYTGIEVSGYGFIEYNKIIDKEQDIG